ncbi:hypothetical protein ACHAW6_013370 [Cyclotella cf. meneghiniana]
MKIPQETLRLLTVASSATPNVNMDIPSRASPRLPRHLLPQLHDSTHRHLPSDASTSCDSTFLACLLSSTCRSCFSAMQENSVDWTNVVPDTPCQDVLGFLSASGHCLTVANGGESEKELFCSAFDACVTWDEDASSAASPEKEKDASFIDCATLAECTWDGIHEHFLGDGICHDSLPGCYNSKVCNYDGGDCCEDTCHYPGGLGAADTYGTCGQEGYACRDPKSEKCQPALAKMYGELCERESEANEKDGGSTIMFDDDGLFGSEEEEMPECSSGTVLYRLIQFDSWGDGWDSTVLTLAEKASTGTPIYKGGLKYGSQGTKYLCLSKNVPKCYHIEVENGVWGNEISWELRPLAGGAPVLAAGGSPSDCTVPLGGTLQDCPNTCDKTRPDTKISDPNYKSYKDMEACIEQKCLIQAGACSQDQSCVNCMAEDTPEYCFANENFNALVDCSMCSCTEHRPSYCDAKSSSSSSSSIGGSSAASHEGNIKPSSGTSSGTATAGSATGGTAVCGPEQTIKGTQSLIKFAECADVDQMMAMLTQFDNDNFGMLDLFEECAHSYENDPLHGGKNALDCMKILHNIILDDDNNEKTAMAKGANGEALPEKVSLAISALAHHLYNDAESFCNCAADTNKETPTCNSFINFKTLLFESVDACRSLDVIDCAAWEEFYTPCKKNLMQMFEKIDFDNPEQCTYVAKMCGGAGPFPAFRRLDCGGEIAKPAWDFHTLYSRGCLKSSAESPNTPSVPSGVVPVPQTPKGPAPKPSPHFEPWKPANSDVPKPYYSPTESDTEPEAEKSYASQKTTHHLRNFVLVLLISCGAGYVYIKKRRENFNYYRFRQMRQNRNYGQGFNVDGSGEYTGVSLADSCSFEPPSLPPTPTTMI